MELGLAWSRWKCFRDIKVRAFFNLAEHTLRKRDGPIPEDWPALQSPLLPVPFSLHVTPRNSSLSLFPFHRSMEPPQMRTNFSPTFLFSLSLLLWRGEGKKKCQACNDRESWTRLESVSPPNGRQPMSNSSLRNRLSRFLRPPLTLPLFLSLSLSPPPPLSNEQLRRNWINLDGEKFREAEQPAKTLFRVALQWGHGFVLKGWIFVFPIPNGYRSFREIGHSYPDLVRRRRGKERPGAGLLKFFIVALFPFGQEARLRKTPKASISRKLGRARLEKVARSETAVGGNESREKGREKAREEGRTVEKMARDDAFQPSSNRGRNHSKSSRAIQQWVSAMGNRVEVCRGEGESFANNSIRPNLPICFPFTASLYLFSLPPPLSFFILSRIFFFFALPFAATGTERTWKD